jgi:hypothetical protein
LSGGIETAWLPLPRAASMELERPRFDIGLDMELERATKDRWWSAVSNARSSDGDGGDWQVEG